MKKTKIICTIGPASCNPDVMEQMVLNGMNVARVNFTHATIEERENVVNCLKEVRKRVNKPVGLLWDTKGPELRCGMMDNDSIVLQEGKKIRIIKKNIIGTKDEFSLNHSSVLKNIEEGNFILLENAKMKLEVISKEDDGVTCKIIKGGILGNRKSVSVPGVELNIPYISDTDKEDLEFACSHGGEFIALSFVSCKEDVLEVKELLHKNKRDDFKLICKIESDLAIQNLEEILEVSDGVMIARGDLGTEVESEKLPVIQKEIINKCREMGKISVVATEMLESMIDENRPKRAETSDIANAVLDGTDAVMLSGETSIGNHPIETVAAMGKICEVTETYAGFNYLDYTERNIVHDVATAICESVVQTSNRLGAKLICAATIEGDTAKLISNLKPDAFILALCPNEKVRLSLTLNWGVYSTNMEMFNSTDEVLIESINKAKEFMKLNKNDLVVVTGSFPKTGKNTETNLLKIEKIK